MIIYRHMLKEELLTGQGRSELPEALPASFHAGPNAKYKAADIVRFLILMCARNASPRRVSKTYRSKFGKKAVPSDATPLNRIGGTSPGDTRASCDAMLEVTLGEPLRLGLFRRPVITATDEHDIPVHFGEIDEEFMAKGKPKSGTSKRLRYTTVKAVGGSGAGLTLAARPTGKRHQKAGVVREQIGQIRGLGIKSRMHLLDKGFYAVDVINALDEIGQTFIMPARWSGKLAGIVDAYEKKTGPGVLPYAVRGKGGAEAVVTLVIVRKKGAKKGDAARDRFRAFVTNAPAHRARGLMSSVPRLYKKRWGIETGYRCAKQCRPFTCSRNPSARLALFYFTMLVYNLRAMVNWFVRRDDPGASRLRPPVELYMMLEKYADILERMLADGTDTELFFLEEKK
ncbi:MAG: transposase, partial [Thaumarchaeota archaeon]|nr:transposase [Nitrososphaerota archaeon]